MEIESPLNVARRTIKNIKERFGKRPPLPDSIPSINKLIWTYPENKVISIAGITSHGKSAFCDQLMDYWAVDLGIPCIQISLEDDKESIMERKMSRKFKIDNFNLKRGITEGLRKKEVVEYLTKLTQNCIIYDEVGLKWQPFKTAVLGTKDAPITPKPKVVLIDYIQLIDDESDFSNSLKTMNNFMKKLHFFAKEEKITIVLACQVNREGAKYTSLPRLQDMQGSSKIEQISWTVGILYWYYRDGKLPKELNNLGYNDKRQLMSFRIAKYKNGRTGTVYLRYEPQTYTFSDFVFQDTDRMFWEDINKYMGRL